MKNAIITLLIILFFLGTRKNWAQELQHIAALVNSNPFPEQSVRGESGYYLGIPEPTSRIVLPGTYDPKMLPLYCYCNIAWKFVPVETPAEFTIVPPPPLALPIPFSTADSTENVDEEKLPSDHPHASYFQKLPNFFVPDSTFDPQHTAVQFELKDLCVEWDQTITVIEEKDPVFIQLPTENYQKQVEKTWEKTHKRKLQRAAKEAREKKNHSTSKKTERDAPKNNSSPKKAKELPALKS